MLLSDCSVQFPIMYPKSETSSHFLVHWAFHLICGWPLSAARSALIQKFKASLVKTATKPLDTELLPWHLPRADERNAVWSFIHHYAEVSDSGVGRSSGISLGTQRQQRTSLTCMATGCCCPLPLYQQTATDSFLLSLS